MAENQKESSSLEQRTVIKSLVAEKCKRWEIYWRMWDVCGETCFGKNHYKMAELIKVLNSILDEHRLTMACTPEIVDSVSVLILVNIRGNFWIYSPQYSAWWPCLSLRKCKIIYCSKNSGNYQSLWLVTSITSLLFRSACILFSPVWLPLRFSTWNKVFNWWWSEEYSE